MGLCFSCIQLVHGVRRIGRTRARARSTTSKRRGERFKMNALLDRSEYSADDVPDLSGKTALVTGATTGVGLEVAKVFASKHARVLVLARTTDQPKDALAHIRAYCAESGGNGAGAGGGGGGELARVPDVEFVACDLEDLEDVKRVADGICARERRLDIVVCDAGVGIRTFSATADGVDRHFAVTHFGHFLLINRLLPLLRRTAALPSPAASTTNPDSHPSGSGSSHPDIAPPSAPRIVCVTSTLHMAAAPSINFMSYAELTAESYIASSPLALYARAKLATILFVKFGLAPRLAPPPPPSPPALQPPSSSSSPSHPNGHDHPQPPPLSSPKLHYQRPRGILALATDPGPIHPGQPAQLADAYGPLLGPAAQLAAAPLERTPAAAARSTLWAATARAAEDDWGRWQGAYVPAPGRDGGESAMARDAEMGARLWEMSEDWVRKRLGADALLPWTWSVDEVEDGIARS